MLTEDGKDVFMMESDSHLFPVENLTDYDRYMDMKPPERMMVAKKEPSEKESEDFEEGVRKNHRTYNDGEKEDLFYLVYEKGMSV
ncbi:hypothetical protein BCR43DRAFT_487932 [Syncephalastrum racemosum]|uniref:Uncharacterized protein n=1 Tax=Syncephalastrum racemosum TaxID=13706 RepID=A0A1X2HHX8_SYNRA|nr:hypothetical protein BCR43DRAFT_487932 [Syncephalastrum racemosum]